MNRNHLGLVFSVHRWSVVDCTYFTNTGVFTLHFLYYDLGLCVSLEIIWRRMTVYIPVAELYPMWGTGLSVAFPDFNVPELVGVGGNHCLRFWYQIFESILFFVFITLPRCLSVVFTFSRVDIFSFDNFFLLAIFRLNHTYSPSSFLGWNLK